MRGRSEHSLQRGFIRALAVPGEAIWPGLLASLGVTALAGVLHGLPFPPFTLASGQHPLSSVLLALLLGLAVRNLVPRAAELKPGITFVVQKLLPAGIVLLGARLDFYDLLRIGLRAFAAAVLVISIVVVATMLLSRLLGISTRLGLLIGMGTAVCGTAAIVATAPVIEAEESDIAFSVGTVNLLGIVVMLLFPALGALFAMGPESFGAWCGLAIHATPQVLAAGFAHYANGPVAGEVATIVKLTRVSLLAPAVFLVGAWYARERRREEAYVADPVEYRKLVPGFVLLFLGMAMLRTLGLLPEVTLHMSERFLLGAGEWHFDLVAVFSTAATWLITCAMAGVGLGIELRSLRQGRARPVLLGVLASLVIAAVGGLAAVAATPSGS